MQTFASHVVIIMSASVFESHRATFTPLYRDWLHTSAFVFSPPKNYPQQSILLPKQTQTPNCVVAISLPQMGTEQEPIDMVYFWKNILYNQTDDRVSVSKAVISFYKGLFPKMDVRTLFNFPQNWISILFEQVKTRPKDKRVLVHYFSSNVAKKGDLEDITKICRDKNLINCTMFIFDFDYCGVLYKEFQKLPKDTDTFAFFACSEKEKLPKSSDLPSDIFTACMITPARMALLWHSWHYYCFKNGPLKPLLPLFIEENEYDPDIIEEAFSNIMVIMRCTVEAIAFQILDKEVFLRLFRTDNTVSQLVVNFVFAARILSFFDVTPLSFPQIPSSVYHHQLWEAFDLRLDAELFKLQEPSLPYCVSFQRYAEQIIISLETAINVVQVSEPFIPQIAYIPSILSNSNFPISLIFKTCKVLACYLDISKEAIKCALYFPMFQCLFSLLKEKMDDFDYNPLLFCLCKLIAYDSSIKKLMKLDNPVDFFNNNILLLYTNNNPKLPLTFTILLLKGSEELINNFLLSDWDKYVFKLLENKNKDTRIWTILLLSVIIQYCSEELIQTIFNKIKDLIKSNDPEERIVVLYCLSQSIINDGKSNLNEEILQFIIDQSDDSCHLIRCQILSAVSYYYAKERNVFIEPVTKLNQDAHELMLKFNEDAHPLIFEKASQIAEEIIKQDKIIQPSYLLESYFTLILGSIQHVLKSPELPYSMYFQPKNDFNIVATKQKNNEKIQNFLKIVSSYSHPYQITSNFVSLPSSKLVFGDSNGNINISNWNSTSLEILNVDKINIKQSINCIRYYDNFSYPLLFTSNESGIISSYFLSYNNEIRLISSFKIPNAQKNSKYIFDVNQNYGKLFFYESLNSSEINLFDLKAQQIQNSFSFDGNIIKSAYCINPGTSLVGACTKSFYLFDLRTKEIITSCSLPGNPFDFRVIDKNDGLFFSICMDNGTINTFDLRSIDGTHNKFVSSLPIVPTSQQKAKVLSFDSYYDGNYYSIGHEYGLTFIDLINQKQVNYTNFSNWTKQRNPGTPKVSSCIFHPSTLSLNILNGNQDIILLDEII